MRQAEKKPREDVSLLPDQEGVPEASLELERLAVLARYRLEENVPLSEAAFNRLVTLATRLFSVSTAMITFYGDGWQWWGATCGLGDFGMAETEGVDSRQALCGAVMRSGQPRFVADTRQDPEYRDHWAVTEKGVQFYASVPLISLEGYVIGTFCLMDDRPHAPMSEAEQQTLGDLGHLVMDELELRLLAIEQQRQASASERLSENLREALAQAETLQAVTALGDLDLSVDDLLLQSVALCASVCDVDLGALVAIHGDRAFVFPAWHSGRGAALAAQVARGLKRSDCEQLWSSAFSGAQTGTLPGTLPGTQPPVFVQDYGSQPGSHLAMVQAGVRAQAHVPIGFRDEVTFLMVLSRLHEDKPWRPYQRQIVTAVSRLTRDLSLQRRQQQALVASRAQLDLALNRAPLILFSVDRAGVFRLVQGSEEEMRRWETLRGRTVDEALAGMPQVLSNIHRAMAGESFDDVVRAVGETYDVRYLHVQDDRGQAAGAIGLGYNVTELVQAEQQATAARWQAEALLELVQTVTGDVLDPRVADAALDALLRMLGGGSLVLWVLRGDRYFPLSRRGDIPDGLRPGLEVQATEGVPRDRFLDLAGAVNRKVYLAGHGLPERLAGAGIGGVALLPLLLQGDDCVVALSAYHDRPWNPAERELLETAWGIFGAGLERRRHLSELERDAGTDALTGVGNRRALNHALEQALERAAAQRSGQPSGQQDGSGLAVVSIDLDGLKLVNDLHGHARGDALLSRFAADLQEALPEGSELFRLGGDEFVAISPLPAAEAALTEERGPDWLQAAVEATRRAGFESASASAGEARFPHDALSGSALLRLSDERLYAQKERRGKTRP